VSSPASSRRPPPLFTYEPLRSAGRGCAPSAIPSAARSLPDPPLRRPREPPLLRPRSYTEIRPRASSGASAARHLASPNRSAHRQQEHTSVVSSLELQVNLFPSWHHAAVWWNAPMLSNIGLYAVKYSSLCYLDLLACSHVACMLSNIEIIFMFSTNLVSDWFNLSKKTLSKGK
jgi:hypothetical protein